MRRITALALVTVMWAAGGFAVSSAAGADVPMQCDGYTLRLSEIDANSAGRSVRLEIRRGQAVVLAASDLQIEGVRCADVTGDNKPEFIIETYSGGAHCCWTIQIFQLQPAFRRILDFATGHAGGFSVQRDRAGRPALVLGDSGLAYYDDLCFACSPSHMPLVACYVGTRFEECTRRFPGVIQEAVTGATQTLKEAVRSTGGARIEYMKGAALGVYAAHALRGQEAEGLAAVRRITTEPQVTSWLAGQRAGVQKWLRGRAGLLTR